MGMGFIQIIDLPTSEPSAIDRLVETWVGSSDGRRSATRATFAADLGRPGCFVQVVEFPSAEAAARNSLLPETVEFAKRLAGACDGPPLYRDLEVRRVYDLS